MTAIFSIVCFILITGRNTNEEKTSITIIPVTLNDTLKSFGTAGGAGPIIPTLVEPNILLFMVKLLYFWSIGRTNNQVENLLKWSDQSSPPFAATVWKVIFLNDFIHTFIPQSHGDLAFVETVSQLVCVVVKSNSTLRETDYRVQGNYSLQNVTLGRIFWETWIFDRVLPKPRPKLVNSNFECYASVLWTLISVEPDKIMRNF